MILEITIYGCDGDGCEERFEVASAEDFARFESEWHTDLTLDLCPDCKETPKGKLQIEAGRRLFELAARTI